MNKDLIAIQIRNEERCYNASLDKYDNQVRKSIDNGSFVDSKEAIILFRASIDTVEAYVKKYRVLTLRGENATIRNLLCEAYKSDKDLAFMLIRCVLSVLIKSEDKILNVGRRVSTVAQNYIRSSTMEANDVDAYSALERRYKRYNKATREAKIKKIAKTNINLDLKGDMVLKLGVTILELIDKSGCSLIVKEQRTDAKYVRLSNETRSLILQSKTFFNSLLTVYYPFVVVPRPWTDIEGSGGYYTNKSIKFIRARNFKDFTIIRRHNPDVSRLMAVINSIQETPYRVNKRVLEVIEQIQEASIVDPSSPPRSPFLLGKIPYNRDMDARTLVVKDSYPEIKEYFRALDLQNELITRIQSKRIGFELSLMVAREFQQYDKIYFSYNTDFRGRLYPIQQYLNPQGTDQTKALLEFGEGQVLTDRGFYWLKIHGANCYGYDKLTYSERIKAIEAHHHEILEIYRDPIANSKYWYKTDNPLLYLAFCFSYGDYIHNPKGLCYNVVQLDGTCSGLQMYAGLLKDREGAEAVNVINNNTLTVSDVYAKVAVEVNKLLEEGNYAKEISFTTRGGERRTLSTYIEANSLKGNITRSHTKRNTMTQPYSVTRRGMFEQLYDMLQEYEEENKVFWKGDKFIVATLLAELNDVAITKVVKGAKVGQKILKDILGRALRETKIDYAYWETPIYRFPVVQRIKKEKRRRYRTTFGDLVLYDPTNETHVLRMLNGIAPNFIHSLDATVLYRTVELCKEHNVNCFWLIHDSYGVLPNDVDTLNTSFRRAYVEVFKENPLQEWVSTIHNDSLQEVEQIMINNLDLDEVISSNYIIT